LESRKISSIIIILFILSSHIMFAGLGTTLIIHNEKKTGLKEDKILISTNIIQYWLASPETKISPDSNPPSGLIGSNKITLFLARNEEEFFHIVLEGPLDDVDITLPNNFNNTNNIFPSENIELFREEFIGITSSTWDTLEGNYPPYLPSGKEYADGLVPFVDPYNNSNQPGRNFSVELNKVKAILVKFKANSTQAPGMFKGNLTLNAAGKNPLNIQISLYVWNFTLPNDSLITNYGIENGYHSIWDLEEISEISPELPQIRQRYYELLAKYKLFPTGIRPRPGFDPITGVLDMTELGPIIDNLITYGMNSFEIPSYYDDFNEVYPDGSTLANFNSAAWNASAIKWYQSWSSWLDSRGILEKSYAFVVDETEWVSDEPYHLGPVGYERVWQWAHLIHQADPDLQFIMADNILSPSTESNYRDLRKTNLPIIWDVYAADIDTAGLDYQIKQLKSKGFDFWLVPNDHYDFIDFSGIHPRAIGAYSYLHDLTGIEAWDTISWPPSVTDPWSQNPSNDYGNGAGAVIYPGKKWGVQGPLPSLRLELNREAIEDFSYFKLASDLGASNLAKNLAHNIIPSDLNGLDSNGINSSHFLYAKLAIAGEILRRSNPAQLLDPNLTNVADLLPEGFGKIPSVVSGQIKFNETTSGFRGIQVTDGLSMTTSNSSGHYTITTLPGNRSLRSFRAIRNNLVYNSSLFDVDDSFISFSTVPGQSLTGVDLSMPNSIRTQILLDSFEYENPENLSWYIEGGGTINIMSSFPNGIYSTENSSMLEVNFDRTGNSELITYINFSGNAGKSSEDELWIDFYTASGSVCTILEIALGEQWEFYRTFILGPGGPFTIVIPLSMVDELISGDLSSTPIPLTIVADVTLGSNNQYQTGYRTVFMDNVRIVFKSIASANLVEGNGGDDDDSFITIIIIITTITIIGISSILIIWRRKK